MLGNFPRDAWHVRGFPYKDVFVGMEKVDERVFLFRGEHGSDADFFVLRATGVHEDLLGALCRLEQPGQFLCVRRFFGDLPLRVVSSSEAMTAVAWP